MKDSYMKVFKLNFRNRKNPFVQPLPQVMNTFGDRTKNLSTHRNRRVTVLNKIFMNHISDLMATGEVADNLIGRGIEISHVKVAPDFSVVNVYWFADKDADMNEETEKVLKVSAGHLQHELTGLRVIGMVPPINFVKNKQINIGREVENRLSKVDFGEDYVPSAHIPLRKVPTLKTSLSADVKAKLSQIEGENKVEEDDSEISVPEMRQDVMGFDHSAILKKVEYILLFVWR